MRRALLAAAAAVAVSQPLQLAFDGAAYTISVQGQQWFTSAGTQFIVGGKVYSSLDGSLSLKSNTSSSGSDGIGVFTSYSFSWTAGDAAQTPIVTAFNVYASGTAIVFEASFPAGTASQPSGTSATDGLVATFPSLAPGAGMPQPMGSLWQDPTQGNCGFLVAPSNKFPQPSAGLLLLSPELPADAPAASRAALGFAALTQQPVVRQGAIAAGKVAALTAGAGAEFDLPAGFSYSTILVAATATAATTHAKAPAPAPAPADAAAAPLQPLLLSHADAGFPAGGVNDALYALGDALLAYVGKPRPVMNYDRIHQTLGYSTIGFYFYNPCDAGRYPNNTVPPDDGKNPHRLPNCLTYQDSLVQVHAGLQAAGIPYGHLLIDSFWYGEGVYGGVTQWTDDPGLMAAVHSFPQSLHNLSQLVGPDVHLWAHNGRWVSGSPYLSKYPFAAGTTMPQGPELWRYLFSSNTQDWNLRTIKQDHVAEQIAAAKLITNASWVSSWLGGMGQGATENGVQIQYCCSPALVLHNSINVPAASSARSSPDYVQIAPGHSSPLNLPFIQWANGVESAFHYSIGLVPDKDGFFSNSTEMQHGGDDVRPPGVAPSFTNFTEANPVKHALSALLCGGPVHVSDAVNATNATLVRALMRADGTLLRGSRPHVAVDAQMRSMMFGRWVPPAAASSPASSSAIHAGQSRQAAQTAGHKLAAGGPNIPNGGLGEVYSTVSLLPVSGGSASCGRWTILTAAQVGAGVNLTAADLALDATTMAAATCTAGSGWAVAEWDLGVFGPSATFSPVPIFDGSTQRSTSTLPIAESASAGYAALPRMYVVAPVINGWLVVGEVHKLLPVSPQRITGVSVAGGSGSGLAVALTGGAGEAVTIAACPAAAAGSPAACAQPLNTYTCTLSASGAATLSLPAGTCV